MTPEQIKFFEDRIKHLEEMLEKSMEMNRKLMERIGERPITPLPYPPYNPSIPYGPINTHCPKCGLKLDKVMGYCCPHPMCPTGLGGTQC